LLLSLLILPCLVPPLRAGAGDDWNAQIKAAVADQQKGDLKAAEHVLLDALLSTQAFDVDDPRAAYTLDYLGTLYQQQGRPKDAIAVFERALRGFDRSLGVHSDDALASAGRLADAYESQGLWAKSEPLRRRLLKELAGSANPDLSALAQAESDLALCLDAQKKWNEAMVLYQDVLEKRVKALGPGSPDVAETLSDEGRVWLLRGKSAMAERLMRRALDIDEKALGPSDPTVADDLRRLAAVLKRRGKKVEAAADEARADAIKAVPAASATSPKPVPAPEDPGPGPAGSQP
ncbi:MAG: tetratricopeptide repeat protein, partial [bacterium]